MKHRFVGIFSSALIAATALFSGVENSYSQAGITCAPIAGATPRTVACDIPLGAVGNISSVEVENVSTNQRVEGARFDTKNTDGVPGSWLFLVDVSNPARRDAVASARSFIETVIDNRGDGDRYGIASFAKDVQVNAAIGAKLADLRAAAAELRPDGLATELYRAATDGINKLAAEGGNRRKALVIISDGDAEDTAFTLESVIAQAKNAGVVIYGVGIPERDTQASLLQPLRRMAEETGGPYVATTAGNKTIPANFVSEFRAGLLGGQKRILIPASDSSTSFNITVTDDSSDSTSFVGTQVAQAVGGPTTTDTGNNTQGSGTDGTTTTQDDSLLTQVQDEFLVYWNDSVYRWVIIGAGVVLAFLLFLLFRRGGRRNDFDNDVNAGFGDASTGFAGDGSADGFGEPATKAGSRFVATDGAQTRRSTTQHDDSTAITGVSEGSSQTSTRIVDPEVRPVAKFDIMEDGNSSVYKVVASSVRIGRSRDNDLKLSHDTVHRTHAILHTTPEKNFILTDLNTKNGVLVNGRSIDKQELVDGDVVELGEVKLTFHTM